MPTCLPLCRVPGGAPLARHVEDFLKVAMCCRVAQGYGLTETCAASFIAVPDCPVSAGELIACGWPGPALPALHCSTPSTAQPAQHSIASQQASQVPSALPPALLGTLN